MKKNIRKRQQLVSRINFFNVFIRIYTLHTSTPGPLITNEVDKLISTPVITPLPNDGVNQQYEMNVKNTESKWIYGSIRRDWDNSCRPLRGNRKSSPAPGKHTRGPCDVKLETNSSTRHTPCTDGSTICNVQYNSYRWIVPHKLYNCPAIQNCIQNGNIPFG